jgi:hypothetical protein
MDWKTTYTKIFLQQANISVNDNTMKEYLPIWWKNSRIKTEGGLRLTEEGLKFVQERLELQTYDVPFPLEFTITTQILIFLDKFIDCPYYLAADGIIVTNEKKAMELHLFSGDIRKYGLTKAMNRPFEH